jgi:hypothetical protein
VDDQKGLMKSADWTAFDDWYLIESIDLPQWYEAVREITIGNEDLHPISQVSFDVAGMDLSDKAVKSEV